MYYKQKGEIAKHIDFILLDIVILEILYLILTKGVFFGIRRRIAFIIPLICIVMVITRIFYNNILRRKAIKEFIECIKYMIILNGGIMLYLYAMKISATFSRVLFVKFGVIGVFALFISRMIYKKIALKFILHNKTHVAIITEPENNEKIKASIKRDGWELITFDSIPTLDEFEQYRETNIIDEAMLDIKDESNRNRWKDYFLQTGTPVHTLIDDLGPNPYIEKIGTVSLLTTSNAVASPFELLIKRIMDIFGGIVGLIITGIATIIFGPIIKHQSPGPIFYQQTRIGRNGRKFQIYKFRSMYPDADQRKEELIKQTNSDGFMFKMDNDPRIIPIGHFIRKHSIDELPQFWNVLKGDMSLVGTRPPTVDEWEQYSPHHRARMSTKPGLTGVWQVSGRSDITDFEEVVKLDTEYIRNWTIMTDIKLILKTVLVVFRGDGAK